MTRVSLLVVTTCFPENRSANFIDHQKDIGRPVEFESVSLSMDMDESDMIIELEEENA